MEKEDEGVASSSFSSDGSGSFDSNKGCVRSVRRQSISVCRFAIVRHLIQYNRETAYLFDDFPLCTPYFSGAFHLSTISVSNADTRFCGCVKAKEKSARDSSL